MEFSERFATLRSEWEPTRKTRGALLFLIRRQVTGRETGCPNISMLQIMITEFITDKSVFPSGLLEVHWSQMSGTGGRAALTPADSTFLGTFIGPFHMCANCKTGKPSEAFRFAGECQQVTPVQRMRTTRSRRKSDLENEWVTASCDSWTVQGLAAHPVAH
jgi:hypothetical protein